MFHDLVYTPSYMVDGVGTFAFRCRYPTDSEMLAYSGAIESILERYREGDTPIAKAADRKTTDARRADIARVYSDSALAVILEVRIDGKEAPKNWRDEFKAEGRPGFVGSMLRAIGVHLFRGPTESSPESPAVGK